MKITYYATSRIVTARNGRLLKSSVSVSRTVQINSGKQGPMGPTAENANFTTDLLAYYILAKT